MKKSDEIRERSLQEGNYIKETKSTIRQTAILFKVSKSTVHKDIAERLPKLNPNLANDVRKILDQNKDEGPIRGGLATKKKYLEK